MSTENAPPNPEQPDTQSAADTTDTTGSAADVIQQLEDMRAKADEHWNSWVRANAELDNVRKRAQRDVENARKFALEGFAQELLPVRDSLEMGLNAAQGQVDVTRLKQGMELTLKIFADAMDKFGIKEINPVDQPFDPAWHQAMSAQYVQGKPADTVVAVLQKGYMLNERLVRPALVIVAKAADSGATGAEMGAHIDEQA